jgi:uncharacterized membrane protein
VKPISRQRWSRDESGSSLILVIFAGVLCAALVIAVSSATSLYLERKRLFSLADAAALVGAESFSLSSVRVVNGHAEPRLTRTGVQAAVTSFVAKSTPPDLHEVRVDSARTPDGRSALVTLSTAWHPPVVTFLMPDGLRIDVTSTARSVLWSGN